MYPRRGSRSKFQPGCFRRMDLDRNSLRIQDQFSEMRGGQRFCALFLQTLFWFAPDQPVLSNNGAPQQSRYLPDCYARASSVRHPLLCTGDPCASPLQQHVTELPKSQELKSCNTCKVASRGLGETPCSPELHYLTPAPVRGFDRTPPSTSRRVARHMCWDWGGVLGLSRPMRPRSRRPPSTLPTSLAESRGTL
jgi:hypothetical protein